MTTMTKKRWEHTDKLKLWILYNAGVPALRIAKTLDFTKSAIEKAIARFEVKKHCPSKQCEHPFPLYSPEKILQSVLKDKALGFDDENIDWDRMPKKKSPWHCSPRHEKSYFKQSERQIRLKNLDNVTLKPERTLTNELEALGYYVKPLRSPCPHRKIALFQVRDKVMTRSQMLVFANQERFRHGIKAPLLIEGCTEWEA